MNVHNLPRFVFNSPSDFYSIFRALPFDDAFEKNRPDSISLNTFQCMPITRELSAGKRKLLQRYINLLP